MATTMTMNSWVSKWVAITFGLVLVLVWLLAFISNPIVGPAGFFLTNTAHDWVHILSGVAFLAAGSMGEIPALRTIQTFGVIYGLVALGGLFMGSGMFLGFIEINMWDNILHIVIAVVALYYGFGRSDQ